MFFTTDQAKKNYFGIFRGNCKRFVSAFVLNAKYSLIFVSKNLHSTIF